MDGRGMEDDGLKAKSFRYEDYNNRRVFLRSYPLHWGEENENEENNQEMQSATNKSIEKKPMKKIILSVFHWGEGKVLILRKFKHKITVYIISCCPVRFKPPTALISA